MNEAVQVFETLVRGGAVGVLLLLAVILLATGKERRARLGGLFALASASFALVSSTVAFPLLGVATGPLMVMAVANSVFFWWFATALFDDEFRWRWWRIAPLVIVLASHFTHEFWPERVIEVVSRLLQQIVIVAMMSHTIALALRDRRGDLVESRRRFRIIFAVVIALTGLIISIADILELYFATPALALRVQALSIFVLSIIFSGWLLSLRRDLFAIGASKTKVGAQRDSTLLRAADLPVFERLMQLMEAGVYREEGLTVPTLAEKVGVPEHQLRRLINKELGFRNFSAFLNERRIADAMAVLADPKHARRQVLQIALDLGYGSIAPFNRAFRLATGQSPTEYRKSALEAPQQN